MDPNTGMRDTALNQDLKTQHTVTPLALLCRSRTGPRNLDRCARRLQADDLHMDMMTGAATLAVERHQRNDQGPVSEPASSLPCAAIDSMYSGRPSPTRCRSYLR